MIKQTHNYYADEVVCMYLLSFQGKGATSVCGV